MFYFKQFSIRHDKCGMKVGTDGVLIGAWACWLLNQKNRNHDQLEVLDVGCGCGLISLMIAQECGNVRVRGIDIEETAVEQAKENVEASRFKDGIEIDLCDFNTLYSFSNKYDVIVSNPPFYTENIISENARRDNARHTSSLSFETLILNTSKLLNNDSDFCVIIPSEHTSSFIAECATRQMYLCHRVDIKTSPHKATKRTILHFIKTDSVSHIETHHTTLSIRNERNEYTEEYVELTKGFYL